MTRISRAFLISLALSASVAAGIAHADTYNLRLASGLGESHPSSKTTEYWAKKVEELSNGRIKISMTWGGALLPSTEVMPGAGDGRVDLGTFSVAWHPAELPLSYLSTAPFLTTNGEAAARAMTEIYRTDEKFRQNYEQQGVHLIMFQPLDILLIAGKTLFDKPETLRGKQIRLVGDAQDILPKVGAQPISIAYEETYESLERGVIDGHAMNFEGIVDIRTDEVAKNMVDAGIGQVTAMNLVISSDVWADFSDEDKKIIEDATADTFDNMSQIYRDLNSAHCDGMVAQGANFFSWSDEDKAFWRDASAQEQIDKWTAKQSDKAYAAEFLDRYKTLMAEFGETSTWESAFAICSAKQGN